MITPSEINLNKEKNILSLTFESKKYDLTSEFLRVYSPSAEVMGHGTGQEVLQVGKENVSIKNIKPTGNYAVALSFSDGHNSGIYSWEYLYNICKNHDKLWDKYLTNLKNAGHKHSNLS